MGADKALLKEIDDVKKLIKESNKVIEERQHNDLKKYAKTYFTGLLFSSLVAHGLLIKLLAEDISTAVSQQKAKKLLQGYYNELAVKQNILIDEQQRIICLLSEKNDLLQKDKDVLNQRLNVLSEMIKRIQEAQKNKIL